MERVNWGAYGLKPRIFESPDQIYHKHEFLSVFYVISPSAGRRISKDLASIQWVVLNV
jgi:hypothetical protein